jgi:peptidoglycan hydrolase-like protein with peptidoglycan-binding domain
VLRWVPRIAFPLLALAACSDGVTPDASPATSPATTATTEATTTTTAPTTTTTEAPTTTSTTVPETTTTTAPPPPPAPDTLHPGDEGEAVLALQQRLDSLGYWLGTPDGHYGGVTQQAVMAFQKVAGLSRDGIAGPATLAALETATRPAPRGSGSGIEIDLTRQVLQIVADGQVTWTINTSTGRSGWRTRVGDFRIYNEIDGMRHAPLGDLWRPKYFDGGIAVHGSTSIPGTPASHGCARVSNAAIDLLWASGLAPLGTAVSVY